ncbi:hypothetical protein RI367_008270 [Sorochytrium milnesiophthora]
MTVLQGVFIHEDATDALLLDYAGFVARLKGEAEDSEETQPSVKEAQNAIESGSVAALVKQYAKESSNILKAPEAQVEGIFAVLLALLQNAANESDEPELLKSIVKSMAESSLERGVLKLKLLAHIYNSVPSNAALRYDVYLAIIKVAAKHNELAALVPQIPTLPRLLSEWSATPAQSRELLYTLAERLAAASLPAHAFTVYVQLLDTLDPTDKNTKSVIEKSLAAAMQSRELCNLRALLASRAAAALKNDKHVTLIQLLAGGDVKQIAQFVKDNAAIVDKTGVSKDKVMHKARMSRLASLAAQNLRRSVTFNNVATALDIPTAQVEIFIIDAIRSNLISAQINQPRALITFTRAALAHTDLAQWKDIQTHLHAWKSELKDVLDAVAIAKVDIDDFESLHRD